MINSRNKVVLSTLKLRRKHCADPMQLVPRGGQPEATAATYINRNEGDETVFRRIEFSVMSFIRGFNLTLVEHKIVRRCVILCIMPIDLHKCSELFPDSAKYWIAEVQGYVCHHPLLNQNVPLYVSEGMLRAFTVKVAIWTRT
jgi:hypothetical protein